MSDEIKFKIYSSGGDILLSDDKKKILESEKEAALNMIKTASFREGLQDPYPSPFLNLSDMNIPRRAVEIFKWCKYFYMFDPLIAGAINSLATFPITDVYLEDIETYRDDDEDSEQLKLYKKVFFKILNIHKLLIEIGIDYWLYGNCFIFGEMEETDEGIKRWKHVVRLDPSKMIIDVNPATNEKKYKWMVPERIARIVKAKKPKEEYEKIPDIIKNAVNRKQAVVLNSNNIYHFARPTDSMGESVWGTPVIANVLKLLMYRNVLRQAQEAIAREHIVPFRVYFFQKTDDYNPNVNWDTVAQTFANELKKAARDPNHKVVSPVPVNVLNIGGQGRALLLTPEIEQIQAEILAGMNVPREFIFGGISYSGSSISLKILENHFITYRLLLKDFMQNFLIKNMAKANGEWHDDDDDSNLVQVKMVELKMQDDVQQKQLIINLNSAGKVTDEYMWKVIGVDPERMKEALRKEALAKVELETEVQVERIKKGIEIQKAQMLAQYELQKFQAELQQKMRKELGAVPEVNDNQQIVQENQQAIQENQQLVNNQEPTDQLANKDTVEQQGQIDVKSIVKKLAGMNPEQAKEEIKKYPQEVKAAILGEIKKINQQQNPSQSKNNDEEKEEEDTSHIEAQKIALQLLKQPEQTRQVLLAKLPEKMRQLVLYFIDQLKPQAVFGDNEDNVDMRPMPEQKPPRRNSLK